MIFKHNFQEKSLKAVEVFIKTRDNLNQINAEIGRRQDDIEKKIRELEVESEYIDSIFNDNEDKIMKLNEMLGDDE